MRPSDAGDLARKNVEPPWDELRAARVQRRVVDALRAPSPPAESNDKKPRRRSKLLWALAAAAVLLVTLAIVISRRDSHAPQISPSRLEFSDGSFAVLGADARVVPEIVAENRVEVRQLAGSALYDIVPRRSRKFTVRVDDVRVDVLGTSFTVDKLPDSVRVVVKHGRVHVTRGARAVILVAGEELTLTNDAAMPSAVPTHDSVSDGMPSPEPSSDPTAPPDSSSPPSSAAVPSALAPALAPALVPSASSSSTSSAPPEAGGAAQLFRRADEARAAGDPAEALRLLRELVDTHPKDGRVALALFTIGRIEAQRGNADAAATAFESCGAAMQGEALAEAALARSKAGQGSKAKELAVRYLELFPKGARAREMERLSK